MHISLPEGSGEPLGSFLEVLPKPDQSVGSQSTGTGLGSTRWGKSPNKYIMTPQSPSSRSNPPTDPLALPTYKYESFTQVCRRATSQTAAGQQVYFWGTKVVSSSSSNLHYIYNRVYPIHPLHNQQTHTYGQPSRPLSYAEVVASCFFAVDAPIIRLAGLAEDHLGR